MEQALTRRQARRPGGLDGRLAPAAARWLLPVGWLAIPIGYFGPWIAHQTAGLSLSGADMAEFVKLLPRVLDGSFDVTRQLFYLPPLALAVSIALLIGSKRFSYQPLLRAAAILMATPVSLQMLPPAWSPSSLLSPEFRAQTVTLILCWLALASFWLWRRLPAWLAGALCAVLSLSAAALPAWQLLIAKPSIDAVNGAQLPLGWGLIVCMTAFAILAGASLVAALGGTPEWQRTWPFVGKRNQLT